MNVAFIESDKTILSLNYNFSFCSVSLAFEKKQNSFYKWTVHFDDVFKCPKIEMFSWATVRQLTSCKNS